jgi:glycine cleavage system H protein
MKTKLRVHRGFPLIPEGDKRCVWMDLGVVSYKICDRDFDCDNCPLNQGLAGSEIMKDIDAKGEIYRDSDRFRLPIFSRLAKYETDDSRYFHPNHVWIQVESTDRVTLGIDGILAVVFGKIDGVLLPTPGKRIKRSESCSRILQDHSEFSVLSPVSGHVVQVNDELENFPDKLVIDSMRGGWLLSIQPDNLEDDLKYCRHGDAVLPWYLKELEWFDSVLARSFKQSSETVGETMYDGGELSRNLRDLMPADDYRRLVVSLLGQPPSNKVET